MTQEVKDVENLSIGEKIADWWEYDVLSTLRDIKWWILHRIHPKHRYHIVKTGLRPNYYDPCTLMFVASFELLCEFVAHNTEEGAIDWNSDEGHRHAWEEMNSLADWYKNDRPVREENWERDNPNPDFDWRDINDDTPEALEYRNYLKAYAQAEDQWNREDETNFVRLVKVRMYMWNV